jgi:hypothetical protein
MITLAMALAPLVACAHESGTSSSQGSSQGSSQNKTASTAAPSNRANSPTAQSMTAGSKKVMTIDCPESAVAKAEEQLPSGSTLGTPGGTGSGSGAEALPPQGEVKKVEGQIKNIDSSRTARAIDIGETKIWVEPSTPVLVNCQMASVADLKPGENVKAAYEEKAGRNVAKVVEAKR